MTARAADDLAASRRRLPRQIEVLYFRAVHDDAFGAAGLRGAAPGSGSFEPVFIEPGSRTRAAPPHRGPRSLEGGRA